MTSAMNNSNGNSKHISLGSTDHDTSRLVTVPQKYSYVFTCLLTYLICVHQIAAKWIHEIIQYRQKQQKYENVKESIRKIHTDSLKAVKNNKMTQKNIRTYA